MLWKESGSRGSNSVLKQQTSDAKTFAHFLWARKTDERRSESGEEQYLEWEREKWWGGEASDSC